VHIDGVFSHACVAAARASRQRRVAYVVRPMGALDPWSLRQKPWRKRVAWQLGVKSMLHGAAAIHYTTLAERRLAESELGLTRGAVIPLGVDEAIFEAAVMADAFRGQWPELGASPYVISLGRLHPKKGIDRLIDVFLEATGDTSHAYWRLVLAGDGDAEYIAYLKACVSRRRADQRVVFTGWLSGAQKTGALQGASLMVLASQQENFGIAVAEAMACGIPVLISEQVNLADEVTAARAGWVSSLEPAALLTCFQEALASADERLRRGVNGRQLAAAEFRWAGVSARLEELYRAHRRSADT
jgi:glycosyltransferase involved in cell wall biosynthesis